MALTCTVIATATVGAGGSNTITFSSIPSTYTDLLLVTSLRSARATFQNSSVRIEFNGTGNVNVGSRELVADFTNNIASNTNSSMYTLVPASGATANTFGNAAFYITNYTSSNNKAISLDGVMENNAAGGTGANSINAGQWTSSSAISTITLVEQASTTMTQYSTATLYGIKKD